MNVDNPFKKECSRGISELWLHLLDVIAVKHAHLFFFSHVIIAWLLELRHILWIINFSLIAYWHVFLKFSKMCLFPISECLSDSRFVISLLNWFFLLIWGFMGLLVVGGEVIISISDAVFVRDFWINLYLWFVSEWAHWIAVSAIWKSENINLRTFLNFH